MQTKYLKNILNKICANLRNLRTFPRKPIRTNVRHSRTITPKIIRINLRNTRSFIVLVLFAVSCSKSPTNSRTGTLTGTVLLEGQTDHSGITVALYKLIELDTTILRYNREYPNVGFPISQATEFDHRLGEMVAESKTNFDVTFKIENIPQGSPREINKSSISSGGYNFVAQKQGSGL